MTGGLRTVGDDAPARCSFCSAEAAGPCASCRRPVCGDCCTLTEGGTKTWAICLDCERRKGRSLRGGWMGIGGLLALVLVVLAAAVGGLEWLAK